MQHIPAKTIITKTKDNSWFGLDYNMNIYKGCCHGCIYCDSRSDCYHVENFDTVRAKENVLELIRDELRRKVKTGVIGTGSMSDPYNPFEKKYCYTRHALELIDAYRFGVSIATKSNLITRDIDVLQGISEHSPVLCKVTVTTFDDNLGSKIEPNVCKTSERFHAIQKLSDAGIFTGLLLMPILPFINDDKDNILKIIHMAKSLGAKFIYPYFGVTLRTNQRDYFYAQLDEQFPGIKDEYMKHFGDRYQCNSARAKELYHLLESECEKLGMLYRMKDIIASYKSRYGYEQLTLF
ncbi:MAG: Radical domain protein [Anaerocolumna sp.]|jgi:DNA repair photolyase|nr:Radical domain protein [Anaerocolumna sp.]